MRRDDADRISWRMTWNALALLRGAFAREHQRIRHRVAQTLRAWRNRVTRIMAFARHHREKKKHFVARTHGL